MDKKERGAISVVSVFLVIIIIALAAVAVYLYMDLRKLRTSNAAGAIKVPETQIEEKVGKEENKTEEQIVSDRMSMLNGNSSNYSSAMVSRDYAMTVSLRTDNGDIKLYLGTDNKLYVESDQANGVPVPGASSRYGAVYGIELGVNDIYMIYEAEFGGSLNKKSAIIVLREDGYFYALRNILDSNYEEEKIEVKNPIYCYIPVTGSGKTIVVNAEGESEEIE